jgi:hypothetical protein
MGQEWCPNQAMGIPLPLATLQGIEEKIKGSPTSQELNRWIVLHTFMTVTYTVSLRGPEGFLLDLEGLNCNWRVEVEDHFIIAMQGKIKGRTQRSMPSLALCTGHRNN